MSNTVNVSTTTNQVVITPQSSKTVSINSGDDTSITVNQGAANSVNISNNVVDTSLTPNTVDIVPPPDNGITVTDLRKTITVNQGTTSTVQVASIGPQGPKGDTGPQGPQGEPTDTGSFIITASSNDSNTILYTKGDGSTFSNVIDGVTNASTASSVTVEVDSDIDLGIIPVISNTHGNQSAIISPDINMFYDQEGLTFGDTVAKLRIGQSNPTDRPGVLELHGGPSARGYITTFNANLQIQPTNNKNLILSASGTGKLLMSSSAGVEVSGHITGSIDSATNATNANKIYVDYGDTSTTAQLIPTYTADGGVDGYKDLHVSLYPLSYYYRTTNDISGVSQAADELHIGGGSNTAGAIFLNSTAGVSYPTYIRSDQDLHLKTTAQQQIISDSPFNISSSLFVDGIVDVDFSGGSTYQIGSTEHILFNSFTGSADPGNPAIIYLPRLGKSENRQIRFLTDSTLANNSKEIHIYPNTSDTSATIDGVAFYELERPYDGVMLMAHNNNWWVIQRKSK